MDVVASGLLAALAALALLPDLGLGRGYPGGPATEACGRYKPRTGLESPKSDRWSLVWPGCVEDNQAKAALHGMALDFRTRHRSER
jgi:hypothetical protein